MKLVELWTNGKALESHLVDFPPRVGECVVVNNREYRVDSLVHYLGRENENVPRPYIRIYMTMLG